MAFCPSCKTQMGATDIRCTTCGYAFPAGVVGRSRSRFVYSSLGDFVLAVGQAMAILGCIGTLLEMVINLAHLDLVRGLVVAPIQLCVLLALFVAFARVAERP